MIRARADVGFFSKHIDLLLSVPSVEKERAEKITGILEKRIQCIGIMGRILFFV